MGDARKSSTTNFFPLKPFKTQQQQQEKGKEEEEEEEDSRLTLLMKIYWRLGLSSTSY